MTGIFFMEQHERELYRNIAELTADVRTIKDSTQDLHIKMADQQTKTADMRTQLVTMQSQVESNKPAPKVPWYLTVGGLGGLTVLAMNVPAVLAQLMEGINK